MNTTKQFTVGRLIEALRHYNQDAKIWMLVDDTMIPLEVVQCGQIGPTHLMSTVMVTVKNNPEVWFSEDIGETFNRTDMPAGMRGDD
jgi:hypothetical protein